MDDNNEFCKSLIASTTTEPFGNDSLPNGLIFGEADEDESGALARSLFAMGVSLIHPIDAEVFEGNIGVGKMVLALPEDPNQRAEIFKWNAERASTLGFDGDEDEGQDHLFIMLD